MDTYLTIKEKAEAQFTEKRSRFLAFAFHIENEEEAKSVIASFKKKYYDARHVCYAYVLGNDGGKTRANDDGEPSGTAGRPILGQIVSRELTYTLVLVVRYFGGVKLGTGPLGVAYKTAAANVLDEAEKTECVVQSSFRIAVPYTEADTAMRFIREANACFSNDEYTDTEIVMTARCRLDEADNLKKRLAQIYTLRFIDTEAS